MRVAAQVLVLAAAAALAAGVSQAVRPHPLPWFQRWSTFVADTSQKLGVPVASLDVARRAVESGQYVIIDARPPKDFAAGHLKGAFSVPSDEMDAYLPAVLPLLTPDQRVLTYCSGHYCDESLLVTQHLLQNGFTNVVLFAGGTKDWLDAGLPMEK